jgi:predicted NBD/HSP70 family sugar kinase
VRFGVPLAILRNLIPQRGKDDNGMIRTIHSKPVQTASSGDVRDINRRTVLNLIRTRQPVSRADLARLSGLQRSTISLIVEQLMDERWVLEGATGRLPRGRRPTFLRLNNERVIIGIDVRPTQTTVALADVSGHFTSKEVTPTRSDPEAGVRELIQCLERFLAACRGKKIEGIGISLPGRFNRHSNQLVFAPNLKWREFDIRTPIVDATGLEVEVENAANACVLAEVWFDHTRPAQNLVVVTVSEGIGTGIMVNGQLVRGLSGMAGEFGHVPLDAKGPLCGCGSRGCWEVFASNRAALRYYFESGSQSTDLSFLDLLNRADHGDTRAARALETMAHYLGRGMRMLVAGLAPESIVVVGDLTRSWNRFGPIIETEVQELLLPGAAAPPIRPSHEDGMARLRGTVALVLQKHFAVYD